MIESFVNILLLKILSAYFSQNEVRVPKVCLYGSGLSTYGIACKF